MTGKNINSTLTAKPKVLAGLVKKQLRTIRRAYLSDCGEDAFSRWLNDNYYILEQSGRALVRELRNSKALPADAKTMLPLLYGELFEFLTTRELSQLELHGAVKRTGRELTLREFIKMPHILGAVFIAAACNACTGRNDKLLSAAITGIRKIQDIDFEELLCSECKCEKILCADVSGTYTNMDSSTKVMYRELIAELAEKSGLSESEYAELLLKKASNAEGQRYRHIGAYLAEGKKKYRTRGKSAIVFYFVFPLVFSAMTAALLNAWYLIPLLYFPLWNVLKNFVDMIFLKNVPPTRLPRMNYETAREAMQNVMVTVSMLMPSSEKSGELYTKFEELFLSSGRNGAYFCALVDLKASDTRESPEDEINISAARRQFKRLSEKYGNRFLLCVRKREYSKTQGCYCGRERKRGAIEELIRFIKTGNRDGFCVVDGDAEGVRRIKHIIALDSDTVMPVDSAEELVAAAIHPLNVPEIDLKKRVVSSGYGIIAPGVGVTLQGASTGFSRLMTGGGGIEAYNSSCSDLYQDLFSQGIFAGKGIIDVDAFYSLLDGFFAEERVLSHDILEGCFLRSGFQSDVRLYDSFPKNSDAYFDRAHRWIRGDVQNIVWLFKKVKTADGVSENPLGAVSEFKIFDNIRRAVTPVIAMLCLVLSLFMPNVCAVTVALISILSVCSGNLYSSFRTLVSGGLYTFSARYYSGTMPAALSALVCAFVNVIMLPQLAFVSLDGCVRALYRLLVSKKQLLQWVVSAEAGGKSSVFGFLLRYLPSIVSGVFFTVFGFPLLKLAGIGFLLFVIFAAVSAIPVKRRKKEIDYHKREKLLQYAAATWKYYDEYCTLNDNFLPPDNVQETPVYKTAHRTSPTNIGLMLLSTLAARDFGFIDTGGMLFRLDRALNSVENMKKYRGNLFNWYDTETLEPLEPKYVSTVDSGNFLCCLVALKEGIKEYEAEEAKLREITERVEALLADTDLGFLYNRQRKLFHIGCDGATGELASSYYDLIMSEARMTSYYAIADGTVQKEHWGTLGRPLVREGGYMGAMSWTGTMFEYYMPQLLLPSFEGTLTDESLRFCLLCQRKRARGKSPVWGISESGFYSFDAGLNYQYKAFGVQRLGLKADMDSELVISPYSSFLSLPVVFSISYRNLLRAEKMGLFGRLGFYEAADFTRAEQGGFSVVKSYMAHHHGMSIVALCNTLNDNIMQKRFMSDGRMKAASELLTEKIPSGAVVFKNTEKLGKTHRPERYVTFEEKSAAINPEKPRCSLLSNGHISEVFTDSGISFCLHGDMDVTVRTLDFFARPYGFFAFVENGKMALSATKAPRYSLPGRHFCTFSGNFAEFEGGFNGIKIKMTVELAESLPCEIRKIRVENNTGKHFSGNIMLYFSPCLSQNESYRAHPAFAELMNRSSYSKAEEVLIFSRKPVRDGRGAALAVGFLKKTEFEFETARSEVLKPPLGTAGIPELKIKALKNSLTETDTCCLIRLKAEIPPRGRKKIELLLSSAETANDAVENIRLLRTERKIKTSHSAFSEGALDTALCKKLLPYIVFLGMSHPGQLPLISQNVGSRSTLWKMGISGDLPVVLFSANSAEGCSELAAYISLQKKLKKSSLRFDIAVIYRESGEYDAPIMNEIKRAFSRYYPGHTIGEKGGVHAVNEARFEPEEINTLEAFGTFASAAEGPNGEKDEIKIPEIYPVKPAEFLHSSSVLKVEGGEFTKASFRVKSEPAVPWCNVHANKSFGTLVSHCSLGCTWAVNSRENRLTPWANDSSFDNRGERLLLQLDGKIYDLLYGASAEFFADRTVFGGQIGDVKFSVSVRVPNRGMTKLVEVKISGRCKNARLAYYAEPVLDFDARFSKFISSSEYQNGILMKNSFSGLGGYMLLGIYGGYNFFTCSRRSVIFGEWDDRRLLPLSDGCVLVGRQINQEDSEESKAEFFLSWSKSKAGLGVYSDKADGENSLKISTGDRSLDLLVNTWLPKQIYEGRILARTGFYQSSGAWGFRDQLQDFCALLMLRPEEAKAHILRSCARQFIEGDVLHWWHQIFGEVRGVRTRCSDDMLFLPYAASLYAASTGDYEIFNTEVHFASAELLTEEEREKYCGIGVSEKKASVFDHCLRAVKYSLKFGRHRLLLIGTGDWNDGFSNVGALGKGESVWLTMFASIVITVFSDVCEKRGFVKESNLLRSEADELKHSVDESAWDGDRYIRAFYDGGEPIGSRDSKECKIDSLVQSFAALSGMADAQRVNTALTTALDLLADRRYGVVRLLAPGFNGRMPTGYIESYPEGIRENAGQYTHASCWLSMALFRTGRADEGYEILKMLNPINKYTNFETAHIYKKEPYFIAGDVYYGEHTKGVGGWSIYTGAAAWYYRTVTEEMLGIKLSGSTLTVKPKLPSVMNGYSAGIRINGTSISVNVQRGTRNVTTVDGQIAQSVPIDGKEHIMTVIFEEKLKKYCENSGDMV